MIVTMMCAESCREWIMLCWTVKVVPIDVRVDSFWFALINVFMKNRSMQLDPVPGPVDFHATVALLPTPSDGKSPLRVACVRHGPSQPSLDRLPQA